MLYISGDTSSEYYIVESAIPAVTTSSSTQACPLLANTGITSDNCATKHLYICEKGGYQLTPCFQGRMHDMTI